MATITNSYQGKFYSTNIASIGDGSTYTTASDVIDCYHAASMAVQGSCVCGSGASKDVVFRFAARVNNAWDIISGSTNEYTSFRMGQIPGSSARRTILLDVRDIEALKIVAIENEATSTANGNITAVNCNYSVKY